METIVPKISSSLSKMWVKICNIENSLFPTLKEELQLEEFPDKESKLIRILDFAKIEENITVVSITNTPKDREEIVREFIAKSVYNLQTTRDLIDNFCFVSFHFFLLYLQTTRDLIDRLHIDRTLRILCGWR